MSEVKFTVNGKEFRVNKVEADTSLNSYLRNHVNLRGTKAMCHEGGCGACIVSVSAQHPVTKVAETFSVNSCLVSILSCHGWAIKTVEGIGNKNIGYHPIQSRLASFNGTQCGYCTPGWVMNMYSLYDANKGKMTMKEVENSFASNICRCTGYRPILDAFKSFSMDADQYLVQKLIDIEDVSNAKMCGKSGLVCTKSCDDFSSEDSFCMIGMERNIDEMERDTQMLSLKDKQAKWYKVYFVKDIFNIITSEGHDSYMLVAGNTAQGVYHVKQVPDIMIDISSVAELRTHKKAASLELGANMTLNEIMNVFQDIGNKDENFSYTLQMYKHMDLIAHIPIRNIGTLAGNLSIKHQHKEFQSDMFILLEGVGATLTITDKTGKETELSLPDYLKTDMKGKIILRANLPPLEPDHYKFQSYKIMPRAQNAHAIVNAAFLFRLKDGSKNLIERARIVYGGISSDFIHAKDTENYLANKNLFSNDVLKLAVQTLSDELFPDDVPPEPSPIYRKKLALGLFYKCIIHISPQNTINKRIISGGEEFDRPVSSGKQTYDTNKEVWPLSQPVTKLEALVQCSGEANFMNDLPTQPDEMYAAFVLSTVHSGMIDKIDGTEALSSKGVIGMLTAKDIPGKNNFTANFPMLDETEEILCSNQVKFHGQPLAIVVAETERLAKLNAEKVKVTYKSTSTAPPVLTIRDALKAPDSKDRVKTDQTVEPEKKGDDVKKVIEGTFDIFGQYHYTMEPQTCVCVPIEDGIDVYSAAQWMDLTQLAIAQATLMPLHSINLKVRRVGGAYGGKISRSCQVATACAVVAKKFNRPTRFVMPIESNMSAIGKRLPASANYKVGVNEFGKIQNLNVTYYSDDGCSHNENISVHAMESVFNCYDKSTWYVQANSVLTETPSNTWCRAPGTTEGLAIIETIMDHIATETGKDPLEVRLINMTTENNPLPDLIKEIKQLSDFDSRSLEVNKFNSDNKWKKRGISVTPMRYALNYFGTFASFLAVYHGDGTIAICHGGIEMGQGMNTKVAQVCAHTLGVPLELITVKPSNNLVTPNSTVTGGSIGSEVVSYATIKACEILLGRLKPIRDQMPGAKWQEIIQKAFFSGIDLSAHYMYSPATDTLTSYDIHGVTVAEVEVDILTGNHQVVRVDLLEDVGESLSPEIDVGQVEGSYIMGLGYWTSEHLVYDKKTGALLTNRTWTYKPPQVKDIPVDFRVMFRRNSPNPAGVLRSKATGEPAVNMAFGITSALRQAIMSSRADRGLPSDKWHYIGIPFTTENIVLAAETKIEEFQL